jgi:hypothetical protein
MPNIFRSLALGSLAVSFLLFAPPAEAYIGPGLGVGAITAILGILASMLMFFVGFVWYPIKRFFSRLLKKDLKKD